jgi:hypothetical protein
VSFKGWAAGFGGMECKARGMTTKWSL